MLGNMPTLDMTFKTRWPNVLLSACKLRIHSHASLEGRARVEGKHHLGNDRADQLATNAVAANRSGGSFGKNLFHLFCGDVKNNVAIQLSNVRVVKECEVDYPS